MTHDSQQLLDDALKLPPSARGRLAALLIESLEETVDDNVEEAWATEIQRRLQEVKDGTATRIPWSDVRRMMRGPDGSTD